MGIFSKLFGRGEERRAEPAAETPAPPEPKWPEISPEDCRKRIEAGGVVVLDVRMPQEHQGRRIRGSKLIPVQQLAMRMGELDPKASYIVHCEHGMRSTDACYLLKQSGFEDVTEMAGGLAAYAGPTDSGPTRA
ncbi:MAG TPA: rhodanese-like domain-containing protein [Planctomycetota bacterium]|nr:rhodanese-like domain-containing protein [Planctomycetota bacterium]